MFSGKVKLQFLKILEEGFDSGSKALTDRVKGCATLAPLSLQPRALGVYQFQVEQRAGRQELGEMAFVPVDCADSMASL